MKLRPLLRLARIPNVFTAFANVVAGVALVRGGHLHGPDLALVAASGALYTAGMVWNDYFDREVDARERPERPIPAQEVSANTARVLGTGLVALGLGAAAIAGGRPLAVALALTLCVLLYDARLKHTALGPLAMGACRGLNLTLGFSVLSAPALPLWAAPVAAFAFTLLITRLSRFEVFGTAPAQLRGTIRSFAGFFVLWLAGLLWVRGAREHAHAAADVALVLCCVFALWRGYRLFSPLLREVSPKRLGQAIGGGILLMPALDAGFVAASGSPRMAAVVFALALPAYLLKRWYYLT